MQIIALLSGLTKFVLFSVIPLMKFIFLETPTTDQLGRVDPVQRHLYYGKLDLSNRCN